MFNSNPFGSFGAKPAATPSPFGSAAATPQTSLFGSTQPSSSGFGGFGGFGATTTTTTQPQTSTFGGFGAGTTQPQTSSFGGFGSSATTQPQTSSFGGFGAGTTQPQTSTFGSSGGSLFGSAAPTQPQSSSFGGFGAGTTSSSLLSAQPQSSTFGGFGSGGATSSSPFSLGGTTAQTQTSSSPFGGFGSTFNQAQKPVGTPTPHQNTVVDGCTLVSITGMPCYSDKSFEELRFEDITHRKDAVYKTGGAATTPSPFGQTTTTQTSSPFGGTTTTTSNSPFGTSATSSPFGQTTTTQTSSPFGASSSSLFGSAAPSSSGGLFGSNTQTSSPFGQTQPTTTQTTPSLFGAAPSSGSGLFGNQPSTQTTSLFNAQTQTSSPFGQTTSTGGGLFGATPSTQQTSSPFGATTGGGLFGATPSTQQTSSPFGQTQTTNTGGGLFGSSLGSAAPQANTGGGLFGATPSTQQTSSPFGQTQTTNTGGGLFGSSLGSAAPQANTGGLFGSNPSTATSPFGQTQPAASTTPLFGGLGGLGQTQQPSTGGGLFGSNPTNTATSSPFGQTQPATSTTSLFGGSGGLGLGQTQQPSTSLFGTAQTTPTLGGLGQTPQPSTSLFGNTTAAPTLGLGSATGGLGGLGQTQQPSTSLFGGLGQTTQPLSGGGLFGSNTSAANPLSLGQPSTASSLGSSFLGSTALQPQSQPQQTQLQQSIQPQLQQSQIPLNNSISSANPYYPVPSVPQFASLIKQQQPNKVITQNAQRPLSHHGYIPRSTTKLVPRRLGPGSTNEDLGFTVLPNPKGLFPIDKFVSKHSKSLNINTSNETEESLKPKNYSSGSSSSSKSSNYNNDLGSSNNLPSIYNSYQQPSSYQASSSIPKSTTYESFESRQQQEQQQQEIEKQKEIERQQREIERQKEEKNRINQNAPKLLRAGYVTEPPIEQLQKLSDQELKCVRYFTIKRPGYGMIVFPGESDVLGLNLDDIVEIETREVTVYKDESKKPEIGKGLNREAFVTLENCYPKKKSGERIKEGIPLEKYEIALKDTCKQNDCSFVSYDRSNGEWVFKVKHFSKYSVADLVYDDMDVDQQQQPQQQLQQEHQPQIQKSNTFQKPLTIPKNSSRFSAEIGSGDSDSESTSVDEDMTVPQKKSFNKTSFARRVNNKEESGLFETSSFVPYDRSEGIAPKIQKVSEVPNIITKKSLAFGESSLVSPFSQSQRQLSVSLQQQQQLQQPQQLQQVHQKSSIFKPIALPKKNEDSTIVSSPTVPSATSASTNNRNYYSKIKIDPKSFDRIVPKEESIIEQLRLKAKSNVSHCTQDNSIYMRRSFRVGWAPGGNFITVSKSSIKSLSIKKIPTDTENVKKESLLNLLKEHHSNSSLVPDNSKAIGWFSLAQVQNQMESQLDLMVPSQQSGYYKRIWSLILKLWGEHQQQQKQSSSSSNLPSSTTLNYSETTIRKLNLNQWLKEVIAPITRDEIMNKSGCTYLDKVFLHLCAKQVKEASAVAIENKDFRLATMISQVWSSNTSSKDLIEKQLELYKEIGADKFINDKRIEILQLVAGNIDQVYKNLGDWIRSFAINFWYKHSLESSIEDSVNSFEESFINRLSVFPFPPYQKDPKEKIKRNHDICFLLLKLYSAFNSNGVGFALDGFKNIFYPENVGKDLLDYQLPWSLYTVLKAIPQLARQPDVTNQSIIHSSFASQLERLGIWQWSIYVLLHIPDHSNFIREEAVKDVIARNAPRINNQDREFLMKQLHIPEVWIDEALAWYTGYEAKADIYDQIESLFKSFQYSKIHNIVFTSLGPNFIIQKRYQALHSLLVKLEPHSKSISTWRYGGQIFLEFINIDLDYKEALSKLSINSGDELETSKGYFNLRIITTRINALLNDISQLSQSSDINSTSVAYKHSLSFMSESLINRSALLKGLPENSTVKLNSAIGNLISTINGLPLTQSYRSKNLDSLSIQIQDSLLKSIYSTKN